MYDGLPVIDVHGHMSTPPHFRAYAYNLIALRSPTRERLEIPDELMEKALAPHLAALDERAIEVQLISPRPVAMMHWERPFIVEQWTRTTNDVIAQQCRLHPARFIGVAQLPQHVTLDTRSCLEEFERCVSELGFVAAMVNPDPGADRSAPALDDPYWYPLYEKAQELEAALIVHPSITRDPRVERIPQSFQYNNLTEETLATLVLENSGVFRSFPRLVVVVCHCGGALSRFARGEARGRRGGGSLSWTSVLRSAAEGAERAWGAGAGGAAAVAPTDGGLFFDTCAYDEHFLAAAIHQRGASRMLFGTEVPGAGSHVVDPATGRRSDDLVPLIGGFGFLTIEEKRAIFHTNARSALPRLEATLDRRRDQAVARPVGPQA